MAINNLVKRIQNIMRQDAGINGDAQRIEQMTWMFFLKVYDTQEEVWELKAMQERKEYESVLPEALRWRNWAVDRRDGEAMTGDELLGFVNNVLFPVVKGSDAEWRGERVRGIRVSADTERAKAVVADVFHDLNQYMKNGTLLRQLVNIIDEIDFSDNEDRHTFGDIYEEILKDLQSAGNAGEFYTPRALTDFIVQMLDVKLGETFGDFTSGTGGFLTSCLNHVAGQVKSAADEEVFQHTVRGQEWKPLPYLLSITNLLLHDIEAPDIRHCDSLGRNVTEFSDEEKVDVIGMNPPYGGSTDSSVKTNFPMKYRSSETADLFIALIMYRLKAGGRCGVIIPDGFLFGTDGAKLALKEDLLRKFNLHTIIRLPGSIFSPYTSIATNILFFNNEKAIGAKESFKTAQTWFYRMDMPEGYKHFSKTHPLRLEHMQVIKDWWNDRQEIVSEEIGEKSRCFSPEELIEMGLNFDQCKFPKTEEEVLPPDELLRRYHEERQKLDKEIDERLKAIVNGCSKDINFPSGNPWKSLAELNASFQDRLRKSVLQEAIQGRLVEQSDDDEPATELLKRIRAEKVRMVKEGKLKKKDLEVAAISDDEKPFEIPRNWCWCRLGEIGIFERGNGIKRDETTEIGLPCVRYGEMYTKYRYSFSFDKTISYTSDQVFSKCRKAHKGDILMALTGENKEDIALASQYNGDEEIAIGGDLCRFTILSAYALYFVLLNRSNYYIEKKKVLATGDIIVHISTDKLGSIPIPLPPLAEQKRIVAKIEELFGVIGG